MEFTQEHIEFENYCKRLIGLSIVKVEYNEIAYNQNTGLLPEPYYHTKFIDIDTIDFSIVIYTHNDVIEIHWDDQFFQFGVGVAFNQPPRFSGYQKWDVSGSDIWKKVLNSQIENIVIGWDYIIDNKNKITYPQCVTLQFVNNEKIFISAAQFLSDDTYALGISDNLLVTNNEILATQTKMIG